MVIAPTIAMITFAIAEMIALIPRPIAEKIDPCCQKFFSLVKEKLGLLKGTMIVIDVGSILKWSHASTWLL